MELPRAALTLLVCCLWGQAWIGGTRIGAIGWLCSLVAKRAARRGARARIPLTANRE